jgi:hypothetical protein
VRGSSPVAAAELEAAVDAVAVDVARSGSWVSVGAVDWLVAGAAEVPLELEPELDDPELPFDVDPLSLDEPELPELDVVVPLLEGPNGSEY